MDRGTAAGGGVLRLRGRTFGPGQLVIMARIGWIPGWRDSALTSGAGSWPSAEATRRVEEMVAAGWPVLVPVPGPSPEAGRAAGLAAAAVWAWLGARVFRADQVTPARRVLDMVAAIRGDRPPARAVRGLA